jgi:hypothetical protein
MAGVYPLFAFAMNGEDAEYISRFEFGGENGGPSASTLSGLDVFSAYVRMLRADGRMTPPFYFTSRPPAPVDEAQKRAVLEARKKYSAPLAETYQQAAQQLAYLDQYGGNLLSQGVTSTPGASPSVPTRAIAGAANVLRPTTSGEGAGGSTRLWSSLEQLNEQTGVSSKDLDELANVGGPAASKKSEDAAPPTKLIDDALQEEILTMLGDNIEDGLGLTD